MDVFKDLYFCLSPSHAPLFPAYFLVYNFLALSIHFPFIASASNMAHLTAFHLLCLSQLLSVWLVVTMSHAVQRARLVVRTLDLKAPVLSLVLRDVCVTMV